MIPVHEAADIFPLDEGSIPELVEDIRKSGLLVPVERLDGKVIDGRRRLRACELAKVAPKFKDVTVADPLGYVLSLNLHRRHLTVSQLAMVGGRAKELRRKYEAEARERQKRKPTGSVKELPPEQKGQTRDLIGESVGVSGKSIDMATKVLNVGVPELIEAVDKGRIPVYPAAEIADLGQDAQREKVATYGRYRKVAAVPKERPKTADPDDGEIKKLGAGIIHATEAINCLRRIPKNDALRKRGFQLVKDWLRHNL